MDPEGTAKSDGEIARDFTSRPRAYTIRPDE
jgi:hypothetical protein